MMENANNKWSESSDNALLVVIGQFILETRLQQNKNQQFFLHSLPPNLI